MLWQASAGGDFTHFSEEWLGFTGQRAEHERGTGWTRGLHPEDRARWFDVWSHAQRSGEPFHIDVRQRRADGAYRWIRHRAVPRRGVRSGFVGSSFDVTDLVEANDALRHEVERLLRSNRQLEAFAHDASHDLQEPLRTLDRCLDQLAQGGDEPAEELFGHARASVQRMQALVRGVLDCAQVDARGVPLEPTELDPVLDSALAALRGELDESGAEIQRSPLGWARCDPLQISQVLQNLIGNSLKFRAAAQLCVTVRALPENERLAIEVQDNGRGIDPARHAAIFERFEATPSLYGLGAGMGLAICRCIVARHGGEISVASAPGAGATFRFTLPRV
jgi:PAS domain S-box-containing protein